LPVDVEEFYKKYGPMVLRRCRFLLKNEEQALDAMQDVFVQILRRKDLLEDTAPSSLLYTTATRVCLNILRSKRRKPETQEEEIILSIASGENLEEKVVAARTLEELFGQEEETTKVIAVLHYVDRLTLEETAERVGMSVSGIRKRLRKLKAQGQRFLEAK